NPEMFDYMFESVPSKAIGIEFDPSHLFWQRIDYIEMLKKYGDRIYCFHAKDTEILEDGLQKYGIIGKQIGKIDEWESGWWRYRIPGLGMLDWKKIFDTLKDIDYKGPIVIEHEDSVFGGTRSEDGFDIDIAEEGLKHGLKFIKSII
ncbi:MAG: sugar phosphate isomerase/epimerase family protein, partial [Saccharofermentanales bacterium]